MSIRPRNSLLALAIAGVAMGVGANSPASAVAANIAEQQRVASDFYSWRGIPRSHARSGAATIKRAARKRQNIRSRAAKG